MTISEIIFLLDATPLSQTVQTDHKIETVCGSDMMSDVLAFIKKNALLLTGLNNLQVIRTAEMLDIVCLVFVRGKRPQEEMLKKADELGITVLSTDYTMFDAMAGEASSSLKQTLKMMNLNPDVIRRCAICMYEGEINMVIHANGGVIDVDIFPDRIVMILKDEGPGIPDVELAMQEGYSTANEDVLNLGFGAGMGLPNMKRSSDEMQIDTVINVGTTVTMTVYFQAPEVSSKNSPS